MSNEHGKLCEFRHTHENCGCGCGLQADVEEALTVVLTRAAANDDWEVVPASALNRLRELLLVGES